MDELSIAGIGISRQVVASVVALAAEKVEGVASVGGNGNLTSSLIRIFTQKQLNTTDAVEAEVEGGKLKLTVHLAAFYGYPFRELADAVRNEVARAVSEQIGVEVASIDIAIDSLVFPKE